MPVPADVSAAYRTLAEAFERMRPYRSGEGPLDGMIELLVENSQAPPKEVKGVSQGFLDGELETLLTLGNVVHLSGFFFERGTLRFF